jgi:hypothetical protein
MKRKKYRPIQLGINFLYYNSVTIGDLVIWVGRSVWFYSLGYYKKMNGFTNIFRISFFL